jgi:DNA-binding protein HU-beta
MTGADIAVRLADELKATKVEAKQIVESVLSAIVDGVAAGDEVALTGFGKFRMRKQPAREGRNPRAGEPMRIAAGRKVVFQPGKVLKDALGK